MRPRMLFLTWIFVLALVPGAAAQDGAAEDDFLLQLVALIPFVGGLVLFLGGPLGAGALVYRLVRAGAHQAPAGEERTPVTALAGV